jgi:hypothetical protein
MPTPTQVYNSLAVENVFDILNPSAPINFTNWSDLTNWASIGISDGAGDAVDIIAQVLDPVGQTPYQNTGWGSDDYSDPDITLLDPNADQFNLFTYTGTTTPIYGVYSYNLKVRVTLSGQDPFYVEKTFSIELNEALIPTLKITQTPDCAGATFTSEDTTSYGAPSPWTLDSLTRTQTVYPPQAAQDAGQSPVTSNAQTVFLSAPDNPLWTGTYSTTLTSDITYKTGNYYTIIHKTLNGQEYAVACDNNLCELFCCLKTLIAGYESNVTAGNTVLANDFLRRWTFGDFYLTAIKQAILCSNTALAQYYTDQFYLKTLCDKNCDCGCTDEPAPVVPTTSLQGPQGPAGPKGETGDTGATGPQGAKGDTGATGATGANGASVLYNSVTDESTTGTNSYEVLKSYTLPSDTLRADGDELKIHTRFDITSVSDAQAVKITFNGVTLINNALSIARFTEVSNAKRIAVNSRLTRIDNTSIEVETEVIFYSKYVSNYYYHRFKFLTTETYNKAQINGLTLDATNYTINVEAKSATVGVDDVTCQYAEIVYCALGQLPVLNGIKYATPFITTNAVQSYPNVLGSLNKTVLRVYLDGTLLTSADWSYNNATDTLTFITLITGASEVAIDYV